MHSVTASLSVVIACIHSVTATLLVSHRLHAFGDRLHARGHRLQEAGDLLES